MVWNDKAENLFSVGERLRRLEKDVDIVLLPELFSTGFISERNALEKAAETNGGPTIDAVRRWATFHNVAICGTYLAKNGENYFNRAFFIEPSGDETYYDKKHLFCMSEEAQIFTPGTMPPPSIRFRGWNISMMVCYDLRFPVWARGTDCRYDLMLVPANWPTARRTAWDSLLAARAIENQAFYIGCNRSGSDDYGDYATSMTLMADYYGNITKMTDGIMMTVEIHRQKLLAYREKFPAWRDADPFSLR